MLTKVRLMVAGSWCTKALKSYKDRCGTQFVPQKTCVTPVVFWRVSPFNRAETIERQQMHNLFPVTPSFVATCRLGIAGHVVKKYG